MDRKIFTKRGKKVFEIFVLLAIGFFCGYAIGFSASMAWCIDLGFQVLARMGVDLSGVDTAFIEQALGMFRDSHVRQLLNNSTL